LPVACRSAPANYQQNWVNVVAPTGATVTVDGTTVTGFTGIGASGYSVARFALCANNAPGGTGVHTATSSQPFGIQVYGYGRYTSYFYPGGLGLRRQWFPWGMKLDSLKYRWRS
jgi:hypothetical protein